MEVLKWFGYIDTKKIMLHLQTYWNEKIHYKKDTVYTVDHIHYVTCAMHDAVYLGLHQDKQPVHFSLVEKESTTKKYNKKINKLS